MFRRLRERLGEVALIVDLGVEAFFETGAIRGRSRSVAGVRARATTLFLDLESVGDTPRSVAFIGSGILQRLREE